MTSNTKILITGIGCALIGVIAYKLHIDYSNKKQINNSTDKSKDKKPKPPSKQLNADGDSDEDNTVDTERNELLKKINTGLVAINELKKSPEKNANQINYLLSIIQKTKNDNEISDDELAVSTAQVSEKENGVKKLIMIEQYNRKIDKLKDAVSKGAVKLQKMLSTELSVLDAKIKEFKD